MATVKDEMEVLVVDVYSPRLTRSVPFAYLAKSGETLLLAQRRDFLGELGLSKAVGLMASRFVEGVIRDFEESKPADPLRYVTDEYRMGLGAFGVFRCTHGTWTFDEIRKTIEPDIDQTITEILRETTPQHEDWQQTEVPVTV